MIYPYFSDEEARYLVTGAMRIAVSGHFEPCEETV
jgi:hypothetical protein